jgi:hypothetical protein
VEPDGSKSEGTLVVYSALDQSPHFNTSDYHACYSDYEVLSEDGRVVKKVTNDAGTIVEGPAEVKLTPGNYRVRARANKYGVVTVPVLVEPHVVTTVHLDGGGARSGSDEIAHRNAVTLPKGEIVGWRVPTNTPAGEPRHVATAGKE